MECTNDNYFEDIKKGDTFMGLKMTLYDGVGPTKTIKNLTNIKVVIPFKKGEGQNNAFVFSTEDGTITIPTPANGQIFLQPRDMNYPAFNYIFDVQLITGANVKKTYFTNYWKIY